MTVETAASASSRRLEALAEQVRVMLRTVGPRVPGIHYREDDAFIRACRICEPPPGVHECPVCNLQTQQRWQLKLHMDFAPKYCTELGAKRARAWSRKV
jgi:hypothetical protein